MAGNESDQRPCFAPFAGYAFKSKTRQSWLVLNVNRQMSIDKLDARLDVFKVQQPQLKELRSWV